MYWFLVCKSMYTCVHAHHYTHVHTQLYQSNHFYCSNNNTFMVISKFKHSDFSSHLNPSISNCVLRVSMSNSTSLKTCSLLSLFSLLFSQLTSLFLGMALLFLNYHAVTLVSSSILLIPFILTENKVLLIWIFPAAHSSIQAQMTQSIH